MTDGSLDNPEPKTEMDVENNNTESNAIVDHYLDHRRIIARQSLENTLVNLDIMEGRIFANLQQMRSDIRQILATM